MASIVLDSRTATTLTCRAVDLPDNAYYVRWYLGKTVALMPDAGWNVATDNESPPFTFTVFDPEADVIEPLEPGTLYLVKVLLVESDNTTRIEVLQQPFATLWEWDSDVSSGAEFSMTAAEFNRFIDLIFSVAAAKEISLSESASSYYVTAGTDMLASQVNAVRSLISALGASVPSEAYAGGDITAAFFNGLVNSLYSIT